MTFDVQWALVGITFLVVIVALFKDSFWNWWNKPLIKIGFENKGSYIFDLYSNRESVKLFRLKIINLGKTVAKNCRVKLVFVISKSGDSKRILIEDPDILKWSGAPKDTRYQTQGDNELVSIYRETKDIAPEGGWEFCDLFEVGSLEKKVFFISSGRRNFLVEDEGYIAIIEISGDNLKPIRKEIKFSVPWKFGCVAKIEDIR